MRKTAKDWWQQQAAKFTGQIIPEGAAALLAKDLSKLVGGTNPDEVLACAREIGVVGEQPPQTPKPDNTQSKKKEEPKTEDKRTSQPMESITDVIRANPNDTDEEIKSKLTKKGISFGKNTVAAIRYQLRKKGEAAGNSISSKPKRGRPPAKPPKEAPAPSEHKAAKRSSILSAAKRSSILSEIDDKITELKGKIEALEMVRLILSP